VARYSSTFHKVMYTIYVKELFKNIRPAIMALRGKILAQIDLVVIRYRLTTINGLNLCKI
jgi:hypothetical protein